MDPRKQSQLIFFPNFQKQLHKNTTISSKGVRSSGYLYGKKKKKESRPKLHNLHKDYQSHI